LFISLINQICCRSHHNHVQCFVCFRYWFMIIEHVLWNLFLLRPKFPTSGIRSGLHVWIYWVKLIFVWTLPFIWSFVFFPQFCMNLMQYHKQTQLPNQHEGPRDTQRNPPDFWINSVKDASWHLVTLVQ